MSKEQKLAKIFKSDNEIAEEMLQKKKAEKKIAWKRIAHYFGIHNYSKMITSDNENQVVKCEYCSLLHLSSSNETPSAILLGMLSLTLGILFSGIGLGSLILNKDLLSLFALPGIGMIWYATKRFCERIWMD